MARLVACGGAALCVALGAKRRICSTGLVVCGAAAFCVAGVAFIVTFVWHAWLSSHANLNPQTSTCNPATHTQTSIQCFHTRLFHTHTHTALSHRTPAHNIQRTTLLDKLVAHNSLTHTTLSYTVLSHAKVSHTTLSHTTAKLCHTQAFRAQLSHTHASRSHTHTQLQTWPNTREYAWNKGPCNGELVFDTAVRVSVPTCKVVRYPKKGTWSVNPPKGLNGWFFRN